MAGRRDSTDTDGRGLGHSFAADNVVRGTAEGNQFIKRRPTYPLGDNPRGRDIRWHDQEADDQRGSVFRSYKGLVPIEGQDPFAPKRVIRVGSTKELRSEAPSRSTDTAANAAAQEQQRAVLAATDFGALFPLSTITEPDPGISVSRGTTLRVTVLGEHIISVMSATLIIDGQAVERIALPRSEQGSTLRREFIFLYNIPADRALGTMNIEGRVYSMEVAAQGVIADTAINEFDTQFRGGVGTLDGRIGTAGSTYKISPKLEQDRSMYLRTPEGVSSISVNVI